MAPTHATAHPHRSTGRIACSGAGEKQFVCSESVPCHGYALLAAPVEAAMAQAVRIESCAGRRLRRSSPNLPCWNRWLSVVSRYVYRPLYQLVFANIPVHKNTATAPRLVLLPSASSQQRFRLHQLGTLTVRLGRQHGQLRIQRQRASFFLRAVAHARKWHTVL